MKIYGWFSFKHPTVKKKKKTTKKERKKIEPSLSADAFFLFMVGQIDLCSLLFMIS